MERSTVQPIVIVGDLTMQIIPTSAISPSLINFIVTVDSASQVVEARQMQEPVIVFTWSPRAVSQLQIDKPLLPEYHWLSSPTESALCP